MSPKMNIGLSLRQDAPMPQLLKWCQEAEEAGFRWLGMADSQILRREFYICYAAFAMNTTKASFLPVVSNVVTRHPSIAASSMLSLYEIAPGRVHLGLGAGDSATYGIGLRMAKVEQIREYVKTVRGLLNGEAVTWAGKTFKAEWRDWQPPVPVKLFIAANGPKTLRMAASVADGIILGVGKSETEVRWALDRVQEGAHEAGRNPEELELWWTVVATLAESKEAARASKGLGMQFIVRGGMEGKPFPEELKPSLQRLYEAQYAGSFAVRGGDAASTGPELATHGRPNPRLVEMAKELGVWDWLEERGGGLDGTPKDIRESIQRLYDRGIRNLMILPANSPVSPDSKDKDALAMSQDKGAFAKIMGKEVLPYFS